MLTQVQRWGNSLAVRIPKPFAIEVGLEQDATVEISLVGDKLVLRPVKSRITLEHLLAQVTEQNVHGEVDTGPAVGREVW